MVCAPVVTVSVIWIKRWSASNNDSLFGFKFRFKICLVWSAFGFIERSAVFQNAVNGEMLAELCTRLFDGLRSQLAA